MKISVIISMLIVLFSVKVNGQITNTTENDTIINGDKKIIILKDVNQNPYLKRFYTNNCLDSVIFIGDICDIPVFDNVVLERMAHPLDYSELNIFISENLIWPADFNGSGIVMLCFVVNSRGTLSNFRVIKGIDVCKQCSRNAIEVANKIDNWVPAIKDNKYVDVYVYFPIKYEVR